jgi:polyferredoxin
VGPLTLVKLRRLSQIIFLALFLLLLFKTEFRGSFRAVTGDIRLPYPVSIFLQADPLVSISNVLSTRALYKGLLWSLVIIIPTLFLGRFFCGWICPLGTLNHFFSSWKSERKRGLQRIALNRYQRWQTLKYYILVAVLVAAVFGSSILGLMDPISLTVRSLGLSILPGINYAFNALFDALYRTEVSALRFAADALHFLLKDLVLSFKQPYFRQGFALGLIFLTIMVLNLRTTRFWCRALCPLGALLGLVSRWSILGLEKHPAHCEDCNRCLLDCQGGDDPIPGAQWRKAECHLCFNCVGDCPESGLKFKFFPATPTTIQGPSLQRRKALASVAAGAAALPLFRSSAGLAVERHERLVRPPGALDEKSFLARCIRCGECMKVCPNNALHPSLSEAGLEGLWTPVLVPRIGYCEPSCVLCSQVCPTGAIWEITQAEKAWVGAPTDKNTKPIRIGTAFYDHGRCLPWAMATECIVCEEWCPTSPKAVYLRPTEVADAEGNVKQVRQPYVDPDRCVGCGACEFACPVQDRPAVYVTSIGESRSKTNQILLRRPKRGTPS